METSESHAPRLLAGVLTGLGAAVAWTALSLLFGGAGAHAAERPMGMLDDLSDLTSTVTSTVSGTVDGIVSPAVSTVAGSASQTATQAVTPVLGAVASAPVVGPSAASATSTAVDTALDTAATALGTAGTAVNSVTRALGDEPVVRIAGPLLDSLAELPVAGGAIGGLDPVLGSVVGGTDAVLGSLGGAVASAVASAVDPVVAIGTIAAPTDPVPRDPSGPRLDRPGDPTVLSAPTASAAESPLALDALLRPAPPGAEPPSISSAQGPGGGGPLGSTGPPGAPPGAPSTSSSSSAGSGGGSGGAVACLADSASPSPRAWERANGARDDALPSSPVFDTDVSPD